MTKPLTARQYHNPNRPDKRVLSPEELPPPSVAIRCHCLECVGWNIADVRRCDGNLPTGKCPLWPHRMGGSRGSGSPGKAIHRHCVICMGSTYLVRACESTRCALWPYRFGANPRTNEEARARLEAGTAPQRGFQRRRDTPAHTVER